MSQQVRPLRRTCTYLPTSTAGGSPRRKLPPGALFGQLKKLTLTLTQAEAPPGALFGQLKKLIDAQGLESSDVAFYFTHWLTDLAGAEPTPTRGCEKFVLRFPQPVLHKLISSMSLVQVHTYTYTYTYAYAHAYTYTYTCTS